MLRAVRRAGSEGQFHARPGASLGFVLPVAPPAVRTTHRSTYERQLIMSRPSVKAALTVLSLTASLAVGGGVAATSASAKSGCYITASAANVRSKPSSSSAIVGVAYRNYTCTEKGLASGGGYWWYKVKITKTGVTGYVRDDLVHTSGDDAHTCLPEYPPCP